MRKSSGLKVQFGVSNLAVTVGHKHFSVLVHGKFHKEEWSWRVENPTEWVKAQSAMDANEGMSVGRARTWQAAQRAAFRACEALTLKRRKR
jgi:hypothetical protein